jgi:hypothetical protein
MNFHKYRSKIKKVFTAILLALIVAGLMQVKLKSSYPNQILADNKKSTFKIPFLKFFEEKESIGNDSSYASVLNKNNYYSEGFSNIKSIEISKFFVKSKKNSFLRDGEIKNLLIGSFSQANFSGPNDIESFFSQCLNCAAINTLVGKNFEHKKLSGYQDFLPLQNLGCKVNRCLNVFLSKIGVFLNNFFNRIAHSDKIENIFNSNSHSSNARFAESNFGINRNMFVKPDSFSHTNLIIAI